MTNSREMAEVAHEAVGDFSACGRKGRRNALPDITEVMAKEKCSVTEAKLRLEELRISEETSDAKVSSDSSQGASSSQADTAGGGGS
ncbi:PREDICTED: cAMP-dependent protein kinase inhibitor gamma-like [Branchiostoma belcheri]|uniref:cAMP-dependent protein kinase inhibitor gamma-like n=1 Tax=Branchiostoma belcheri TaxID=7741 RepID=A0A6P4ZFU6_BRABE|nr:PREDICTED: cAMP-dependent protein kinase inhibitor gamma-like [Branchiostoma belcheri]